MNTKLTLSIDQSVIEKAKQYARKKERSLSDLIENYLKALTSDDPLGEDELSPTVKSLKGAFELPEHLDYKKALTDRLAEKHL